MARELAGERVGAERRGGGASIACDSDDRVNGATGAEAADLVEPGGVERIRGLFRVQQDRVARHNIPRVGKTGGQPIDDRLIACDQDPAIRLAPAATMEIAQYLSKRSCPVRIQIDRHFRFRGTDS
ncbi:hypothetical protein AB4851_02050 [Burkholderia sp. 22PA0099]|uniref:hypothetical protein n=1 Tax=Burkholderia sp. 22PA0099 TaxID=3237372 RepID=UPI0039C0E867